MSHNLDILISNLKRIDEKYPELLQPEFFDFIAILEHSADIGKYPLNNWLEKDGKGCDKKSMYASIFRHIAESYVGCTKDKDSGFDPRLHGICRLVMDYTRSKQGLVHPNDYKEYPDIADNFYTYHYQTGKYYSPDKVSHPETTLGDILEERDMSVLELSDSIGVSVFVLESIIAGKANITPMIADQLEQILGIPKDFWLQRGEDYD